MIIFHISIHEKSMFSAVCRDGRQSKKYATKKNAPVDGTNFVIFRLSAAASMIATAIRYTTLTSIPRAEPRYSSCEKKFIAVPWYAVKAAIIAQTAYFIHRLFRNSAKASGRTPSAAMVNTTYFIS